MMKGLTKKSGNKVWIIFFLINAGLVLFLLFGLPKEPVATTWKEFYTSMLPEGDIEKLVVINKEIVHVYLKPDSLDKARYTKVRKGFLGQKNKGPHYGFSIGSIEVFEQRMEEYDKMYHTNSLIIYQNQSGWFTTLISWLIPIFLIILIARFVAGRFSGSSTGDARSLFDFGKSTPQVYDKERMSQVTFKDVAGYDEAKTEIMEVVDFLKDPSKFTRLGAHIPKGILLIGAPGTGKTLMAKAIAGEAGVPFFSLTGSSFMEMFVGVGASRVRDLFQKAKVRAPSIVFIDEIDAIGRMRGKAMSIQSNEERDSTLNQLLAEMDGFGPQSGVIVLAATNRADILDPALLRPGRFDRHIYLDLPNRKERIAIFHVHMRGIKASESVKAEKLAALTPGFSGADIANLCNEAALIAARKKHEEIEDKDFSAALDRVIGGLEKKSMVLSKQERAVVAYHEAGHTLVSWMLPHLDPIEKVTIIPRGKALGGSWFKPEERQLYSKKELTDHLCAALAGRCAEEIVFGDITSGALDDLEKATKQAYVMVGQLGFSEKLENISYYDSTGSVDGTFIKPFSESTAKLIDEEVRLLLKSAQVKTMDLLQGNREKLDTLAEKLLKKEELFEPEIALILGKRIKTTEQEKSVF
jgi:cell division protease FtsH